MSEGCLVSHNWIIVVNDVYTVEKDSKGFANVTTKAFPSQWDEKGAKEIEKITFRNNKDEIIKPKRIFYKDWYRKQILEIENSLRNIEEYKKECKFFEKD